MGLIKLALTASALYYAGVHGYVMYHLRTAAFRVVRPRLGSHVTETEKKRIIQSRQPLVRAVLSLYQAKPSSDHLSFYAPRATFTDPFARLLGRREITTAFCLLPKALEKAETLGYTVEHAEDWLAISLVQRYTVRYVPFSFELPSVIHLTLTERTEKGRETVGKGRETILTHSEFWYGKAFVDESNMRTLGVGRMAEKIRRFHGWLVTRYELNPPR
ncbi:uncharacterized protein LOC118430496 [Branchiostoma floridae]|uniref:Uncharacterized protein LOC118430496 n=1 Tax=Branchiostoma floridae TaxID=7739 RepID=C3YVU8_BRAFL|nr:uncharacterized protein LOC118430496 [Branchiostoma floridae]XP_035697298.1 uncharacterized protein LOC118430496 [Branchiostoma floridae]|eukprot:XP_002599620.1 hypothetical protein BRAFLDRAFT_121783 [Branchiostoma floridae]